MAALDPIAHLLWATEGQYKRVVSDLKATPAEAKGVCPGGCARSPLNFVAECGLINGFIGGYLRGDEVQRMAGEERDAFLASFDTEEKALNFLEEQTNVLLDALRSLDPSTLGDENPNFFGRVMTRFAIAELPATHMSYHDGQLNQLHMIHGDRSVHWS